MDAVVIVIVVLVIAGAAVARLVRRTRSAGVPADEPMPPDGDGAPAEPIRQVLTREALVNPDRRLDVSRWDNSPDDRAEEEIEGELPLHFDREYLRRRQE